MTIITVDAINFELELWECYKRYIEKLRRTVADRFSHNRAVTLVEVNPPTEFFDIVLRTNNHNITVRSRRDNLYLIGYQMEGSDEWLELTYDNRNPHHRIPNSTFLDFGETYANLRGEADIHSLTEIQAGRQELINAINTLATSTNNRARARSLLILVVMITESIRFIELSDHFGTIGRRSIPIPAWVENYVRGWGDLSAALLHTDVDNNFRLPDINNFGNIRTVEQACAIIGTMKGFVFGPGPGPGRFKREAVDVNNYPAGRPLVEFFSMTINNINGNEHILGDVYGTIQVSDGLGDEYVYNRGTNGFESVRASETVMLNGPARCITAYDSFIVNVKLMSRELLSEDDEISKGKILWEITNISTNKYDKLLFQQVKGRFGLATLSYAVLRNAVEAIVEVTLVKKNGDPTDVYGLLTFHNVNLNSETVLFWKKNNKFVNVKSGKLVPLSRSVVAVSLNSNFTVRADLKGSNIFSSDEEIAKGIATFSPQLSGTHEQRIYGNNNNNQIQVKVTWSWNV